jgi:hypothetical protein
MRPLKLTHHFHHTAQARDPLPGAPADRPSTLPSARPPPLQSPAMSATAAETKKADAKPNGAAAKDDAKVNIAKDVTELIGARGAQKHGRLGARAARRPAPLPLAAPRPPHPTSPPPPQATPPWCTSTA